MLEILKYPDERLHQKSAPVSKFDSILHKLLDDMAETMYAANGVGLAAPQVAQFIRAFVIDLQLADETAGKLYEFVNPVITQRAGKIVYEEGCLSLPGFNEEVNRNADIVVKFQDRNGMEKEMDAHGLLAVAIQHENDHLDGVLFVDRLTPLRRRLAKKKLSKALAF